MQVRGDVEFLQVVACLQELPRLEILYVRNQLEWPIYYNVQTLRYGFHLARLSAPQDVLDNKVWFAKPD